MTYKTILAYLPDPARVDAVLDVALPIARAHEAHLIGLHVVPQPHVYWAVAAEMSAVVLDAQREFFAEVAAETEQAFQNKTAGQTVICEWRRADNEGYPVAEAINAQAAACDLVVAPQAAPDDDWTSRLDLPARIIMESGRPVLVAPHGGTAGETGRVVTLGWDNSREASRAAFDALPFLTSAQEVRLLCIDASNEAFTPADEIAASLTRHGVSVEAERRSGADGSTGETLLAYAAEHGSHLLVMGCYGHTRFRELVFGGATRHVLQHADLPVLMSH